MAKAQLWIFGALLAGCAVNDMGLVNVRYYENESSYLLTRESWGGYLSTRQSDGGLSLGHAERIMIYPKPGNQFGLSINELLQQSTGYAFVKEIEVKDVDLKNVQPYAWIEKNQGIIRFFDTTGTLHDDVGYWFKFMETIKGSFEQKRDMIPSFIEHHFIDKYIANIEKNMNR